MKEEYIEYPLPKKGASSSSQAIEEENLEKEQAEDILNGLFSYESIYQPEEDYLKGKGRINRNLHLLEIFRDRIHKTPLIERATSNFLLQILLDLEQEFTGYLRTRKCRWIDKQGRDLLRKEAQDNLSEAKVGELLVLLNTRFIHIETFVRKDEEANEDVNSENEDQELYAMKKRKNKLWKAEKDVGDEEDKGGESIFDEDFETDTKNYFIKRKVLKTWGFYNEKFKQAWETFVSNADSNHIGSLYLGAVIFIEIICRYITRKFMKVSQRSSRLKKKASLSATDMTIWLECAMWRELEQAIPTTS